VPARDTEGETRNAAKANQQRYADHHADDDRNENNCNTRHGVAA
jgi:hypothetical protein